MGPQALPGHYADLGVIWTTLLAGAPLMISRSRLAHRSIAAVFSGSAA